LDKTSTIVRQLEGSDSGLSCFKFIESLLSGLFRSLEMFVFKYVLSPGIWT